MENTNEAGMTKECTEIPELQIALQTLDKQIEYNIILAAKHKVISARLNGDTPSNKDKNTELSEPKTIIQDIKYITEKLRNSNYILEHSLKEFELSLGKA